MLDPDSAYRALLSRDPRFDGLFFVGVTSTGIYCRPICPVKPPRRANCRFFENAGTAETAGFRPCLRCRPELAPGHAPVDQSKRIARLFTHRIDESLDPETPGIDRIAESLGLSARQLRRIIRAELGVTPIQLLQTRRLLLAKQLLTDTRLPVIDIAFASGFSSLRRFNDAFLSRYRMPPSRLRKSASGAPENPVTSGRSPLLLTYRPPYDWDGMLAFLSARTILGVESVDHDRYSRTVRLGGHTGWVDVTHLPARHALGVTFSHSLSPALPALISRLRNLFDLDARPDLITRHLSSDSLLKSHVLANPGLRVPGAFDSFEMAMRAILGQQITVKAATTIAGRLAAAFGQPVTTTHPQLTHLSPSAATIAAASTDAIAKHGIIASRANSLIAIARAISSGHLRLEPGADPLSTVDHLVTLPGIGRWTAHYLAMRALRWPDAFPKEDIILRKRLGNVSPARAELISQPWRPWRSYAVIHLWRGLPGTPS